MAGEVHTDSVAWGWSEYFTQMSAFFQELERQRGVATSTYCEYAVQRLENCETVVQHLHSVLENSNREDVDRSVISRYSERFSSLLLLISELRVQWEHYLTSVEQSSFRYRPTVERGALGRPRFVILQDQLEYLHSLSFTWEEIASIFQVSRMTIYRRRVEYDMVDDPRRIPSDQELVQLVEDINQQLPYLGEVMVMGRLRSMGYFVTRSRLRLAIRDVDPINRALRWGGNARARHPYSVPGPNSLWHIGKYYCTWVS